MKISMHPKIGQLPSKSSSEQSLEFLLGKKSKRKV